MSLQDSLVRTSIPSYLFILTTTLFLGSHSASAAPIGLTSKKTGAESYRNYSIYLNAQSRFMDIQSGKQSDIRRASREANKQTVEENLRRTKVHATEVADQIRLNSASPKYVGGGLEKRKVVVFVHGGLNTIGRGLKRIKIRSERMLADGFHPVFINWRSGLVSSYWEHLRKWRPVSDDQGKLARVPVVALTDSISMVAETPLSWGQEAFHAAASVTRKEGEYGLDESE